MKTLSIVLFGVFLLLTIFVAMVPGREAYYEQPLAQPPARLPGGEHHVHDYAFRNRVASDEELQTAMLYT